MFLYKKKEDARIKNKQFTVTHIEVLWSAGCWSIEDQFAAVGEGLLVYRAKECYEMLKLHYNLRLNFNLLMFLISSYISNTN